jgi:hypothetical protein
MLGLFDLQAKAAILSVSLLLETPGLKGSDINSSSSSDEEDEEVQVHKETRAAPSQHKGGVQFDAHGSDRQQDSDDDDEEEEEEGRERNDNSHDAHILATSFTARTPSKTM